jgi:hypothetical protein
MLVVLDLRLPRNEEASLKLELSTDTCLALALGPVALSCAMGGPSDGLSALWPETMRAPLGYWVSYP